MADLKPSTHTQVKRGIYLGRLLLALGSIKNQTRNVHDSLSSERRINSNSGIDPCPRNRAHHSSWGTPARRTLPRPLQFFFCCFPISCLSVAYYMGKLREVWDEPPVDAWENKPGRDCAWRVRIVPGASTFLQAPTGDAGDRACLPIKQGLGQKLESSGTSQKKKAFVTFIWSPILHLTPKSYF
jgi:hypothetical protein